MIRKNSYLFNDSLTGLDGTALDPDVLNVKQIGNDNMQLYFTNLKSGHGFSSPRCRNCFVLPSDRIKYDNIENKTKKELCEMIRTKINEMRELGDDDEAELMFVRFVRDVQDKLHVDHVNMYIEVDDMVDRLRSIIDDNDEVK